MLKDENLDVDGVDQEESHDQEGAHETNENITGIVDMFLAEKRKEILYLLRQMTKANQLAYIGTLLGFSFTKDRKVNPMPYIKAEETREMIALLNEGRNVNMRELFDFVKQISEENGVKLNQYLIAERMDITGGYLSSVLSGKKKFPENRKKEFISLMSMMLVDMAESTEEKDMIKLKFQMLEKAL